MLRIFVPNVRRVMLNSRIRFKSTTVIPEAEKALSNTIKELTRKLELAEAEAKKNKAYAEASKVYAEGVYNEFIGNNGAYSETEKLRIAKKLEEVRNLYLENPRLLLKVKSGVHVNRFDVLSCYFPANIDSKPFGKFQLALAWTVKDDMDRYSVIPISRTASSSDDRYVFAKKFDSIPYYVLVDQFTPMDDAFVLGKTTYKMEVDEIEQIYILLKKLLNL
ncbi:uncharacterized protein LOC135838476 isoform X1 [Planococcus citri]|uniref:uncharacterized protein LOC135838476 isoform X1 n=1 Tax=Planococcus citri TaxID=170843 RepID=UPI0031F908EF